MKIILLICNSCGQEIETKQYITVTYKLAQGTRTYHYHIPCIEISTVDTKTIPEYQATLSGDKDVTNI